MTDQPQKKPLLRQATFWYWLVGCLLMPFRWDVFWEQLFRRISEL